MLKFFMIVNIVEIVVQRFDFALEFDTREFLRHLISRFSRTLPDRKRFSSTFFFLSFHFFLCLASFRKNTLKRALEVSFLRDLQFSSRLDAVKRLHRKAF